MALYINEVKRDSEMLQTINKVEACLTDYQTVSARYSLGHESASRYVARFTIVLL